MLIDQKVLLEKSPLAILVCDEKARIVWCNTLFLSQTKLTESEVINQLYSSLPIEAIDHQGETVKLFTSDTNDQSRFQHWVERFEPNKNNAIHYFLLERNSSQNQTRINDKIAQLNLPRRANWLDFLDYEISRSRRYDNPLSILKLHILILNEPEQSATESIQSLVKSVLMDELRWADMIGHTEQGSYLMVLPETPLESVNRLREKLSLAIKIQIEPSFPTLAFKLVFADACWRKNDDCAKLLKRARVNLVQQLEELLADSST